MFQDTLMATVARNPQVPREFNCSPNRCNVQTGRSVKSPAQLFHMTVETSVLRLSLFSPCYGCGLPCSARGSSLLLNNREGGFNTFNKRIKFAEKALQKGQNRARK
ncbi:MAG: hypothetical protein ABIS51_04490 [Sphingomonas sp.]